MENYQIRLLKATRQFDLSAGPSILYLEALVTATGGEVIEYQLSHCSRPGDLRFYACQESI